MSGRAARKALRQRELELEQQRLRTTSEPTNGSEEEDGEEEEQESKAPAKPSLFALLASNPADDDTHEDEDDEEPLADAKPAPPAKSKKKSKKKKKKAKGQGDAAGDVDDEDEIDRALRQLSLNAPPGNAPPVASSTSSAVDLSEIFKIDSRKFDAAHEMRRLFGREAISAEDEDRAGAGAQRGARGGRARMIAHQQRLQSARKNIFIQPNPEWPPYSGVGLGMEVVKDEDSMTDATTGVTEFRFVHSHNYQDTQRQFMICVQSMDPERLFQLLRMNFYHIATLLQVTDIFTQQRDHTHAGDMLQRALFAFGRSAHSSFASKLADGKARLSFRRPENREFFLAVWRYIKNICMRGTYRTGLEWARMLLSLDPVNDPYQVCLLIDFLALKSHQPEMLIALAENPLLESNYADLPNIAFSTALACQQAGKPELASEYISKAITKFPWIPSMLYREIGIDDRLPPALWGNEAPEENERQQLLAHLYIERAKDLWAEPDARQLLVESASTIYNLPTKPLLKDTRDVDFNLARHVMLTDVRSIVALLPREIKTREDLATFDPLPPADNLPCYDPTPGNSVSNGNANAGPAPSVEQQRNAIAEFFRALVPWANAVDGEDGGQGVELPEGLPALTAEDLQNLRQLAQGNNLQDLLRAGAADGEDEDVGAMVRRLQRDLQPQ